MKKIICTLLVAIAAFATYGQFFPKAGFSVTTASSDLNFDQGDLKEQLKAGFLVGAGYQVNFGNFAIQPELLFIQKGSTSKYSYSGGSFSVSETTKVTLNYLELPVLFKYMMGPDALRIYLSAGPSFALGLGGKGNREYTADFGNGPYTEKIDFKVKFEKEPEGYEGYDQYIEEKTDVGLQFGGGLLIANKLMVDLRYGLGFTEYNKDSQVSSKNRAIQVSIGFLIGN